MKKVILNYLIIAALICSVAFTSCNSKRSGNVKLLESMTTETPEYVYTTMFEYDTENRIVKKSDYLGKGKALVGLTSVIYNSDGSVKIVNECYRDDCTNYGAHFVKNGNTITVNYSYEGIDIYEVPQTITINNDGYITRRETIFNEYAYRVQTFKYRNGNLIAEYDEWSEGQESVDATEYKYDKKKSPFSDGKTPKWLMQILFHDGIGLNNNVIERKNNKDNDFILTYMYEYDSDGFPTKQESAEATTHFTYIGELESSSAKTVIDNSGDLDDSQTMEEELPVEIDEYGTISEFMQKVKNAIAENDKEWLANHISYPLNTTLNGQEKIIVENRQQLIDNFEQIFFPSYKEQIEKHSVSDLFSNWQGTMLGNGEIWVGENIIIAINNNF